MKMAAWLKNGLHRGSVAQLFELFQLHDLTNIYFLLKNCPIFSVLVIFYSNLVAHHFEVLRPMQIALHQFYKNLFTVVQQRWNKDNLIVVENILSKFLYCEIQAF